MGAAAVTLTPGGPLTPVTYSPQAGEQGLLLSFSGPGVMGRLEQSPDGSRWSAVPPYQNGIGGRAGAFAVPAVPGMLYRFTPTTCAGPWGCVVTLSGMPVQPS